MFTEMYHATFKCYLDSILSNGLGGKEVDKHHNWDGSQDGVVCLATDGDLCIDMCESSSAPDDAYNSGIVLLSVDCEGLEFELEHDPNILIPCDSCYWIYRGIISPDRIQVVEELLP